MKKAQGISINVIIIAAIALLVLVVLSVIFIGRMGDWGSKTNDCLANGGLCRASGQTCGQTSTTVVDYKTAYPIWSCKDDTATVKLCCIKAGA